MRRPKYGRINEESFAMMEASRVRRGQEMLTAADALRAICVAVARLRDLGWQEAVYCPKDGSVFLVCEAGSTGVFDCYYYGDWPDGYFMVMDERDEYPTSFPPLMWKKKPTGAAR